MSNDQSEIDKFDQLADEWWQPEGKLKTLHQINPLRLQFIQQYSPSLNQQAVADIGCGGGILSESLALEGAHVTGVDLSDNAIQAARQHAYLSELSIDYQVCDSHKLAAHHAGKFDIVTCMELLEHVDQPDKLIADCSHLLKPGGYLFISTLNRHPKAYWLGIVAAEYLLNMLPRGTHDYSQFIKPCELAHCLRNNDMTMECLRGITYKPCQKSFILSDDVSINYLAAAQKKPN